MPAIQFWFDFASPYALIAAKRVQALAGPSAPEFTWKPFLVGVALQAKTGGTSTRQLTTEAEARYRRHDIHRSCRAMGLPLRWPSTYPRGSMLAARIAFWAQDQAWQVPFIDAVFEANFLHDQDIGGQECLCAILKRLGLEAESIIAAATTPNQKTAFRAHVENALEAGVFGVPMFVAKGEYFWGNDRMDQALAWAAASAPPGG